MKVDSKFMSGEVKIESVRLSREGLIVVGKLKEMLPVEVVMTPRDAAALGRAVSREVASRFFPRIAARLGLGK